MSVSIDRAYDACERIVQAHAGSFAGGIQLLPAHQRRAMSAIYAFARRVDDIADGDLPTGVKIALLARARTTLPWKRSPDAADQVLVALDDASRRFRLPLDAFEDLIDGVQSDARERVSFDTFAQLVVYCREVAGSIGRLAVAVLHARDTAEAARLADDLGVALQLTNILRDVIEDRERGRVYLPRQELARFGSPPDPLAASNESMTRVILHLVARNRGWYQHSRSLPARIDGRGAACIAAMTGVYERLLDRIEESPEAVLRGQITLTMVEKARIVADALAHFEADEQAA